MNRTICGRCGTAAATSRIDFQHMLPAAERHKHGSARALMLDIELCGTCAALTFKHLKRFFGLAPFRRA